MLYLPQSEAVFGVAPGERRKPVNENENSAFQMPNLRPLLPKTACKLFCDVKIGDQPINRFQRRSSQPCPVFLKMCSSVELNHET
jgi:hypothetical protein